MWSRNVQTFLGCDAEYADAKIAIFGAPFDSTASYRPGSRFASQAMRNQSFGIETYSPYLDADLTDHTIFDAGDLELPFGDAAKALDMIESTARQFLDDGKIPLMIGGEHLVTLGAVRAAAIKYPDLHIVHFDAHADLRDDYLGVRLSHATVLRRCWEIVGDRRIHQFGIRSGERSEFEWGGAHVATNRFSFQNLAETVDTLKGKPVYFTLDLDVLDPSVFPGTGTPEPGGVTFLQLLEAVRAVCPANIVACDINELCPMCDANGVSTIVACKLLRELLLGLLVNMR